MATYNNIPIKNIYLMLCYAWGNYKEQEIVDVETLDPQDMYDLFCAVLSNALSRLVKKGLYKEYISERKELGVIRGKINFSDSIRHNTLNKARIICDYDEFSDDIIHNQIIKSTVRLLINNQDVAAEQRASFNMIYRYFANVSLIRLNSKVFKKPTIHPNNHQYQFILNLCELIYEGVLIGEQSGKAKFKTFELSDKQMAALFENFVRHFYKRELKGYQVHRENIPWIASGEHVNYLPRMQTDITIENQRRKIIMDTKFYRDALSCYYQTEKIRSENLYQLQSYMIHDQMRHEKQLEGVLLYPTVNEHLNLEFEIQRKRIRILTVDLNQDFKGISKRLKEIID